MNKTVHFFQENIQCKRSIQTNIIKPKEGNVTVFEVRISFSTVNVAMVTLLRQNTFYMV